MSSKVADYRTKSTSDLNAELRLLLKEKMLLRMQPSGEAPAHRIKEVRHDIARIKTILNEQKAQEAAK